MRERGSANDAMLTREQAQAIVEKAVKMSKVDAVDGQVNTYSEGNIRFADNQVSTAGTTTDAQPGTQRAFGPKHAVVTTNDLSDEAIKRATKQSERLARLARLAPDDPEAMAQLGAQPYAPVSSYFESSSAITAGALAIGNSTGMFAYHRSTNVNDTLTARPIDGTGSGWAAADHADWAPIDTHRVAETAVQNARLSPKFIVREPGRYTVILEPQASTSRSVRSW